MSFISEAEDHAKERLRILLNSATFKAILAAESLAVGDLISKVIDKSVTISWDYVKVWLGIQFAMAVVITLRRAAADIQAWAKGAGVPTTVVTAISDRVEAATEKRIVDAVAKDHGDEVAAKVKQSVDNTDNS